MVDDSGLFQPPDVLQQDSLMEIQFHQARAGDKRRGGAEIALCRRNPAQLLADGGAAHQ